MSEEGSNHDSSIHDGLIHDGLIQQGQSHIPVRRDDITAPWLTGLLAGRRPGVVVDSLEVLDATQGAATRLRLRVRYAAGQSDGLPEILFVKTALTRRLLVSDPHMYVTEVTFYDAIRPLVSVETPEAYAWAVDVSTGRHVLVLEDLAQRQATFPSALSNLTPTDLEPLVAGLAHFHAVHWGHADVSRRYPWLETATTGRSAQWWRTDARSVVDHELTASPYKAEIAAAVGLDRLFVAHAALQQRNDRPPRTVLHGDLHIGNTYLLPDGSGGMLDWQLMIIAGWACDLAYLIVTALDTDSRRAAEVDLVHYYLDRLRARGVETPKWDLAWADYRAQMVWGILSWLVTPTAMYDEARLSALLKRCVVATEDLGTYDLLSRRLT